MTEKDYAKAHVTMMTCAARYNDRAMSVFDGESDDRWGRVLASTYLMGVIDMARLYLSVVDGGDIAPHVGEIDARIDGYLDGSYRGDGEDAEKEGAH